jgi:CelD/BcsL family acetyltransferase involved in cellulose biosynthesis
VRTELITDFRELETHRLEWDLLAGDQPFARWAWIQSWWEEFGAASRLAVVLVRDQAGHLVGAGPWFKTISRTGIRQLRVIGSGATCADYVGVLAAAPRHHHVGRALAAWLSHPDRWRRQLGRIDRIDLEGHAADDVAVEAFVADLALSGFLVQRFELPSTWVCPLPRDWEAFVAQLSKSFRRKARAAAKQMAQPNVVIQSVSQPEQLADTWPTFVDLHQQRRRHLGQRGCFADCRFERFLHAATNRLMAEGRALLISAIVDDEPLSTNLVFRAGTSRMMYQSGIDCRRLALRGGHLLTAAAIRQAIDEECTAFDFLRGDEPYKADWSGQPQRLLKTQLVPPWWSARWKNALWTAGRHVKRAAQQWTGQIASPSTPDETYAPDTDRVG